MNQPWKISHGVLVVLLFLLFLASVLWKLDVDRQQTARIDAAERLVNQREEAERDARGRAIADLEARVAALEKRVNAANGVSR